MHALTLTLADDASAWNGPAWVLVIIVLSFLLSGVSSLGVGLILYRNKQVDDRLHRGDEKFEALTAEQATIAVDAAMKNGEVQKVMYRDFVTRAEFEKHTTRMAAFETETLKGMSRVETKLDLLLKREEGRHGA